MKAEYTSLPLVRDDVSNRFELEVNGHKALIVYTETAHSITLVHTEAAPELEGKGAAAALVEKTLAYIEESGKTVIPQCPYVYLFIKRHPEWKRIVAPDFSGFRG